MQTQTQLPFWLFGCAVLAAILHNFLSAMLGTEEIFFFCAALLLFLVFIICVIYNVFTYSLKGEPKDIWKFGWLGLFGLLGMIAPGLYGFYGFFGFFGLKKK